jgi:hypothetical protein
VVAVVIEAKLRVEQAGASYTDSGDDRAWNRFDRHASLPPMDASSQTKRAMHGERWKRAATTDAANSVADRPKVG